MRNLLLSIFILVSIFFTANSQANTTFKSWTVLVFMNLDDGLLNDGSPMDPADIDANIDDDVKLLEKAGSTDQVNIVVQRSNMVAKNVTRLLIQKSTDSSKVISPVLQNLGAADMGDYLTLQDFIDWAIRNYPAQHYLIISDAHGGGWYDDRKNPVNKRKSVNFLYSPNSDTHKEITSPQLGQVMLHMAQLIGHKIDINAWDVCEMQDIETATELVDSTHLMIGSEDDEDGATWPFEKFLTSLTNNPKISPETLSKIFIDAVSATYQTSDYHDIAATYSVVDLDRLPELNQAIAKLADNIRSISNTDDLNAIIAAQGKTVNFKHSSDLLDFTRQLQAANIKSLDKNILNEVQQAFEQTILYRFNNTTRYQNLGGLGIWTAGEYYDFYAMKNYPYLKFNRDTKWGAAIATWGKGIQYPKMISQHLTGRQQMH
jgi:Clostripain family